MSIDPAIKAQLLQTAYVQQQVGVSASGDPTWGPQVPFLVRVESRPRRVLSSNGEEIVSDVQLITEAAVDVEDRVWEPGADELDPNAARVPKQVARAFNEDGSLSHREIFLG